MRGSVWGRGAAEVPAGLRGVVLAVAVVWAAGCESPRPPLSCGAISEQTVFAGDTTSVEVCFEDPNGDALVLVAMTSDPGVALVATTAGTVSIEGVAPGTATVTVTATDAGGLQGAARFPVVVPNRAPETVGVIPSLELAVGDSARLDVSEYFSDPDGQGLSYAAATSDPEVAMVSGQDSVFTTSARAKGTATVTVTAADPEGLEATLSFDLRVPNRSPQPVGSIPARTVEVGETVIQKLVSYFSDPDGDPLSYGAHVADVQVAGVSVSGDRVSVAALAKGETTVTVTATDTEGLAAEQPFSVTVPNRAPLAIGTIPADTVPVGDSATVDLATYFRDPDGDSLAFSATASDTAVVELSVAAGRLKAIAITPSDVTLTVTAADTEGLAATQTFRLIVANRPQPRKLAYERLRTLPHDPDAYTQGLLIHDSVYYESTGRYGKSEVRKVDIATGEVLRAHALSDGHFGEGLARVGDRLIQLTWKAGLAFVYDAATLAQRGTFEYAGEGWGLCHDGESLYMSNGGSTLQRRDPDTFDLLGRIGVTRLEEPVHSLNELECVGDYVYANIFRSNEIVRIDKVSGVITGELDAEDLALASGRPENPAAVFNGIAYDPRTGTFHVTGKLWPVVFEIEIREERRSAGR